MDCFFAAIEIRERPALAGRPVAVGGLGGRGVLTTCNYEARKFGCRSAMPVFKARQLCPELIVLPVRFELYRSESKKIRRIFAEFTELIEPLSLDEAYLDVTHLRSEGASIAWEIRNRIRRHLGLTASAGIAPNKFLAKISSDWNKPDGQFEISGDQVSDFVRKLPIEKIWGVGKQTTEKLHASGIRTCGDMQKLSAFDLVDKFGKFGRELFHLCRGTDHREVNPSRERKSLSSERTFSRNLESVEEGRLKLEELISELTGDLSSKHGGRKIRVGFVKLKFDDFQVTTAQRASETVDHAVFEELLKEAWLRGGGKSVRLIGAGVRFFPIERERRDPAQMEMFSGNFPAEGGSEKSTSEKFD